MKNIWYFESSLCVSLTIVIVGYAASQCVDSSSHAYCQRVLKSRNCHPKGSFHVISCCGTCGLQATESPLVASLNTGATVTPGLSNSHCTGDNFSGEFCREMAQRDNICERESFIRTSCCSTCLSFSANGPQQTSRPNSGNRPPQILSSGGNPGGSTVSVTPTPMPLEPENLVPILNDIDCGKRYEDQTFFSRGTKISELSRRNSYENKVFGGVEADKNSWPWMALVGTTEHGKVRWFCGGSLINDQWVLTAAHCLLAGVDKLLIVRLGEHNISKVDTEFPAEDFLVEESFWYDGYQASQNYHDVALLKLDRQSPFNRRFRPICLPWGGLDKNPVGENAVVAGWGAKAYLGEQSQVLREAFIEVFDTKRCSDAYSVNERDFQDKWPQGMDSLRVLCAGHPLAESDACQGDSGGPLMLADHERYTQIAIVSAGFGCGHKDFPGLYAPIYQLEYMRWIRRVAFS